MLIERVDEYVRKGRIEMALNIIGETGDCLVRTELLSQLLRKVTLADDYRLVKGELISCPNLAPDKKTKAISLSIVGEALLDVGEDKGIDFLGKAIRTARSISNPEERAAAMIGVGMNLTRAGFHEDANAMFNSAFEVIVTENLEAPTRVRLLKKLADTASFLVEVVDSGEWAITYLELAAGVYEYLGMDIASQLARNRARIVERAVIGDLEFLRRLLAEDRLDEAVLMARFVPGEYRALAFLEVSFWLFANDHPELGRELFSEAIGLLSTASVEEKELESVARDFVKLGRPEMALQLAKFIGNEKAFSRVLFSVAIEYYKHGEELLARTIAEEIPDETVKSRALQQLGGEVHVGYKQGLQVISGGEKR